MMGDYRQDRHPAAARQNFPVTSLELLELALDKRHVRVKTDSLCVVCPAPTVGCCVGRRAHVIVAGPADDVEVQRPRRVECAATPTGTRTLRSRDSPRTAHTKPLDALTCPPTCLAGSCPDLSRPTFPPPRGDRGKKNPPYYPYPSQESDGGSWMLSCLLTSTAPTVAPCVARTGTVSGHPDETSETRISWGTLAGQRTHPREDEAFVRARVGQAASGLILLTRGTTGRVRCGIGGRRCRPPRELYEILMSYRAPR